MLHLYGKCLIVFDNSRPPMFGRMSGVSGRMKTLVRFVDSDRGLREIYTRYRFVRIAVQICEVHHD